jgi:hypothetical protein
LPGDVLLMMMMNSTTGPLKSLVKFVMHPFSANIIP